MTSPCRIQSSASLTRLLIAVLFSSLSSTGCATVSTEPMFTDISDSAPSIVPMQMVNELCVVSVHIQGQGPYRVLLDTGAGVSMIADDVVSYLNLPRPKGPDVIVTDSVGEDASFNSWTIVDQLRIGSAQFSNVAALAHDFSQLRERSGVSDLAGIIGFPTFKACLLTLDYPLTRIVIEQGSLRETSSAHVIPLVGDFRTAKIDLAIHRTVQRTTIDSGSNSGLAIQPQYESKVDFKSGPIQGHISHGILSSVRKRIGQLDGTVYLAGHALRQPLVDIAPTGLLGGEILGDFRVTFDQVNKLVRFEREAPLTVHLD